MFASITRDVLACVCEWTIRLERGDLISDLGLLTSLLLGFFLHIEGGECEMVRRFVVLYTILGKRAQRVKPTIHTGKCYTHRCVSRLVYFSTTVESPPAIARIPGHNPCLKSSFMLFLFNIGDVNIPSATESELRSHSRHYTNILATTSEDTP